jgi:hypothetical protein
MKILNMKLTTTMHQLFSMMMNGCLVMTLLLRNQHCPKVHPGLNCGEAKFM